MMEVDAVLCSEVADKLYQGFALTRSDVRRVADLARAASDCTLNLQAFIDCTIFDAFHVLPYL